LDSTTVAPMGSASQIARLIASSTAEAMGISRTYVNDLCNARRAVTESRCERFSPQH
jgi:plasmid maintenance system antidote protein VapI